MKNPVRSMMRAIGAYIGRPKSVKQIGPSLTPEQMRKAVEPLVAPPRDPPPPPPPSGS